MSVRFLISPMKSRNPAVVEVGRKSEEDNLGWMRRVLAGKQANSSAQWSLLLLVGGNDPLSFRLRVAQSHVRHDLSPSLWSHVAFVHDVGTDLGRSRTRHVSLAPRWGFGAYGYPLPDNGIQAGHLDEFASAERFPNIALLSAPVPSGDIVESLRALQRQRSALDVAQLIIRWLTFCWGVGVPANPLGDGFGIPSAALLEAAFAAKGFDLTPGLESRSSCPEAIWQAATWWHGYYSKVTERAIRGAYCAAHRLVPDALYGSAAAAPAPDMRAARTARKPRTQRRRRRR